MPLPSSALSGAQFIKNKTKLFRRRALHRGRIFLNYHARRRRKRPFFVLAARRTGSNLLLSYLNSVPGVSFAPEILHPGMWYGVRDRFISKRAVLRHVAFSIHDCPHEVCGAKFVETQLAAHGLKPSDLRRIFPEAGFLVLYRRSVLDQLLSLRIAELTGDWLWRREFRVPEAVSIEPAELAAFHAATSAFYRSLLDDEAVRERSVLLTYEELAADPQRTFDEKLFPFLGVPRCAVTSGLRRQNTKSPAELLANHAALSRAPECRLDPAGAVR
ncbi:MAG TPA: sulfotransferase [Candidatus Eisenbacteria bacterium]|jgi:LPS sulfotransferase NodH|nr:sulfotransferase [Candidatus Eisenbacteria bacterium]